MFTEDVIRGVQRAFEKAQEFNYRLLIYLTTSSLGSGILTQILRLLLDRRRDASILFAYREREDETAEQILKEIAETSANINELRYDDAEKVLGTTWDAVIMDANTQLRPNDLGLLVELVRGGGFTILIGPSVNELDQWLTEFHKKSVTPPFELDKLVKRFERRMFSKTLGRTGTIYIDQSNGDVIFGGDPPPPPKRDLQEPPGELFPKEIYDLCLTNEQILVLKTLEEMLKKRKWSMVLRANRGRGKSAALGLATASLIASKKARRKIKDILVTAPEPENVQTLFEFAMRGLEAVGIEGELIERNGAPVGLKTRFVKVFYRKPLPSINAKADIILVDEAAGIPVPILIGLKKRFWRAIYSSTIHGYEGAGRGFLVRFLGRLRRELRQDLVELEMKEPIRYAIGDPVESWLYDVLLLDSEPAQLDGQSLDLSPGDCRYVELDRDFLFTEGEELLRQLVGLYVLTHYRNRPNDIALLANAPHHSVRALLDSEDRVIAALHLCLEGGLSDDLLKEIETLPKGHMIPAVISRYYPHLKGFGRLKGLRIVRIAVHPDLWRRGFGSYALKKLCEEAAEKKFDWVGSGFGASPELLRFWLKNGFYPLAVGPMRNKISGEFSVIVVKPLSDKAAEFVREIGREFRLRFINALADPYFNMDMETAWTLLSKAPGKHKAKPNFRGSQRMRLESYLNQYVTYEGASDSIKCLVEAHFLTSSEKRLILDEKVEKLLITKVLQGRQWPQIARLLKDKPENLVSIMRETVEKMADYYL